MERKRSGVTHSLSQASGAAVMRIEVTDALSRAFFTEWSRVGYAALSLERVAKAANIGKAALYRRRPSKAVMASDLLSRVVLTLTDPKDMGSLEADLRALLRAFRRVLRHWTVRRIVIDLLAEVEREPALEAAARPFQRARRERVEWLIGRAVARGELVPTVDRETIVDFVVGPICWRLLFTMGRCDAAHIERLVCMTKASIVAAS